MPFHFEKKIIYLISPQNWGVMKVSKHHYALELAERGNRVFFIEPPSLSARGIQVKASQEHFNLSIVTYKPIFRGKRFLPAFIFNLLIRAQIFLLILKIGVKPDVVWSFSGFLFENLNWFGAAKSIFFAADLSEETGVFPEAKTADCVFGVSDAICKELKASNEKVYLIHHGLSRIFQEATFTPKTPKEKLIIGYSGNLRMEALDRKTMRQVISTFADVQFIFWGSYELQDANLGSFESTETDDFIQFLKNQPNVELRGPVATQDLVLQFQEVDAFWLCWELGKSRVWDAANPHKLVEYLSTGKPIVSHYLSTYLHINKHNLLYMLLVNNNEDYIIFFKKVIQQIKHENASLIRERIDFALDNTYSKHLSYIESLL